MPTNRKEYMREYARQRRAGIKKPIVEKKKIYSKPYFTENEIKLIKKLFKKALKHKLIRLQEKVEYQKIIDKITGE